MIWPMTLREIDLMKGSVTYDDGQNMRSSLMAPCPFCGEQRDESAKPYVQYGPEWVGGMIDARVVCPRCHVSTSRASSERVTARRVSRDMAVTEENVTKYAAAAMALRKWNVRPI